MECAIDYRASRTFLRVGEVAYALGEPYGTPFWSGSLTKRGIWEGRDIQCVPERVAKANTTQLLKGAAEFGLHTDDDREYFFSKFGDLVGVVRIKRKQDGSWSAKMEKDYLPRVLSADAVANGLMPEPGKSALPASLERVVPEEFHYWKKAGEEARVTRDKLVESGFFTSDCVKVVDGELRKVEVKFFLYEPDAGGASSEPLTLAAKVSKLVGPVRLAKSFNPFEAEDWLEELDKADGPESLAILSAEEAKPRELAKAVMRLEGDWLVHCADTRSARAELAKAGFVFKVRGEADLFASSFVPEGVIKAASIKTVEVQGIPIYIDRPIGYVQTGKDQDGNEWSRTYQNDYGFFAKTQGGDGEELDVFLGGNEESTRVFWVTQNKADGSFDEFKVFVGFDSPRDALDAYQAHIPMKFYAGMTETPISQLKALLGVEPSVLAKAISLDDLQSAMYKALREQYPTSDEAGSCCGPTTWPSELFSDHVVFCKDEKYYSVNYTYDSVGKAVSFTSEPVEVVRVWQDAAKPQAQSTTMSRPTEAFAKAFDRHMKIVKAEPGAEQRYVLGIVLEPDIIDSQNDTYSAEEIRQAEHKFMEEFRNMGLMHKEYVNEDVKILESYLAPADFELGGITVKKGTWLMGVRVLKEELWNAVKSGGLTGFSIGGSAVRKPAA